MISGYLRRASGTGVKESVSSALDIEMMHRGDLIAVGLWRLWSGRVHERRDGADRVEDRRHAVIEAHAVDAEAQRDAIQEAVCPWNAHMFAHPE